jgi:UDP-N-acetylglucosamine--N-acetylmuramyl-(pentapeptide) pyrophosphoryl-undecaprenol N-acetylglucosamine transferase
MKVLIAGGGTGGHLYPGVALAEEVVTRKKGNEVLFVGTRRGLEARVVPQLGYPIEFIDVSGLKRTGLLDRVKGLFRLPAALLASARIVRRFQPDVAIGVGGYASGPALLAAWLLGVPTVITEQNTVPGVTNRILGRLVAEVHVTFGHSARFFPEKKVVASGNPIRRQLLDNFLRSKVEGNGKLNLLVLGGSQGAHAVNLRMVEAASALLGALGEQVRVVHQTGKNDEALVRQGYQELGIDAEVHAFIDDVSAAYRRADLVVCRAGATTLAEVTVAKKPAILIPYPFAADNHQELNGQAMVEGGAAVMLLERELDGRRLAEEILGIGRDPARLEAMAQASARLGRPEAAREIVDACDQLIRRRRAARGPKEKQA